MMNSRIPVTILTGFLGSGKTTVLRNLLINTKKRLAVVINEFGTVGLDGDLIRSCEFCPEDEIEGRLVELNNGCLCCTVQDDFLPTINNLLSLPQKLDGIVIETSGLALPLPLLQALEWPSIRSKVHINGVVTLVDGEALSNGSPVGDVSLINKQRKDDPSLDHMNSINELFDDQLKFADLVLVSRNDLLKSNQLENIEEFLRARTRKATKFIPIINGDIDSEILLGLNNLKNTQSTKYSHIPESHHDHHHHIDISSEVIRMEIPINRKKLELLLIEFVENHQVIRLKGRCWLDEKKIPLQIQMVGPRINSWFESVPLDSWKPNTTGIEIVILSLDNQAANLLKKALEIL